MTDFHETQRGRRFYEHTMPQIAKALDRIATAMEKSNEPVVIEGTKFTGLNTTDLQEALRKGCSLGINMNDLIRDLKTFEYEDVCKLALMEISQSICRLPMAQILNECKARHDSAFTIEELTDIQGIFVEFKEVLEKYLLAVKENDDREADQYGQG